MVDFAINLHPTKQTCGENDYIIMGIALCKTTGCGLFTTTGKYSAYLQHCYKAFVKHGLKAKTELGKTLYMLIHGKINDIDLGEMASI